MHTLVVQLPAPEARTILRNWDLMVEKGETVTSRTVSRDAELLDVLARVFGLHFPPATRFRFRSDTR